MEHYKAATLVSHMTGKPATFIACLMLVVVWGASGPLFGYSETWQLIEVVDEHVSPSINWRERA